MKRAHWLVVFVAASGLAGLWTQYAAVPTAAVSRDEGVHLVLSRALADGAGYPYANLESRGTSTSTPPLVPVLLASVWQLAPEFPANLVRLKLVSGLAALGIVLFLPAYLCRLGIPAWIAVVATLLTAWSPLTARQAGSIVSALPFGFLVLATLCSVERAAEPRRGLGAGVLAGTCAGLAVLTRWPGVIVALVVGIQVARRMDRERLAGYCYGVVCTTLPWVAWLTAHGRLDGIRADFISTPVLQRLAELPAAVALATLPGISDLAASDPSVVGPCLLYGLGLAALIASTRQRFGPPILSLIAASIVVPGSAFPMAVAPFLLAALLAAALPIRNALGSRLTAGLVVASLLLTAGVGHYRSWIDAHPSPAAWLFARRP